MKTVTINQLQAYSGIKAHTIRIWEKRYNLLQPQRTEGNIRGYTLGQVDTFLDLVLLNKNGYKISRLVGMTSDEIEQKKALLTDADSLAEKSLKDLLVAYLVEDIDELEDIIQAFSIEQSVSLFIRCLLLPFAQRTGLLWSTHRNFTTIEKLVFEMLRRKLLHLIDKNPAEPGAGSTVLLAAMPFEQNNLPLLFAQYFLQASGSRCIAISDVNVKDLQDLVQRFEPAAVLTTFTRKKGQIVVDEWKTLLAGFKTPAMLRVLSSEAEEFSGYQDSLFLSVEEVAQLQQQV